MNAAQIKKLQNKVAKVVDKKFKEKEAQEQAATAEKMKVMASEMKGLETKFPNRGPCNCVCDGWIWLLRKGIPERACRLSSSQEEIRQMECISRSSGKSYYMFSEEVFKENTEFMNWVAGHYAEFKMSLFKANKSEDLHERMTHMLVLGGLHQEMTQKFPKRTPIDLKAGLQAMDMVLQGER